MPVILEHYLNIPGTRQPIIITSMLGMIYGPQLIQERNGTFWQVKAPLFHTIVRLLIVDPVAMEKSPKQLSLHQLNHNRT